MENTKTTEAIESFFFMGGNNTSETIMDLYRGWLQSPNCEDAKEGIHFEVFNQVENLLQFINAINPNKFTNTNLN